MIRHIRIKNFAIIENAEIDFYDGLNIITGETGAGKSIVIEAISLALGSRADASLVRTGTDKAVVQMVADLNDREYIITREISSKGRNLCRINDEIVTLSQLSSLCRRLADIHGQYDHQSLLDKDRHLELLDMYKKDLTKPAMSKVSSLYEQYSQAVSEYKKLNRELSESKRQRDFMEFELQEITDANLRAGEDAELEESISLLENSEKIYENLANAYRISSEDEEGLSLLSSLKNVSDMMNDISEYSPGLGEISERLSGIYYEFEDICSSIRECRDESLFSPDELDRCLSRYDRLQRLKDKYSMNIEQIIDYAGELTQKLSHIDNADAARDELKSRISDLHIKLKSASDELSEIRKQAASELESLISSELRELNFNNSEFKIDFSSTYDVKAPLAGFSARGTDTVEFLIATNRGEPLKPLSKIASGGEMSRIMLAFKRITADYDMIPTMIFDEIDAGISGIAATVVGRKLLEISDRHQIICITHLPQIAACGQHNFRIYKESDDMMTYTSVEPLSDEEKVQEIARLLGGANITKTTLASARELIEVSKIQSQ